MKLKAVQFASITLPMAMLPVALMAQPSDPRLREIVYDPAAVTTVPVKRGVVTLIVFGGDEAIADVGAGLGGDCSKPESAWCIAAQPGARTLFVKPKSGASAANNLAVVTDKRVHSLRFVVLADSDPRPALYRLRISPPAPPPEAAPPRIALAAQVPAMPSLAPAPVAPDLLGDRLQSKPPLRNTRYSLAEGRNSSDILPSLVFDDGRFTYFRFPGNREVPAVFQVLGDGSEALVNTRMEDDLLIVDRVSRQLMLRAGQAVIAVWNDAFDIEGLPPSDGTTVPGVRRVLKEPPRSTSSRAELPRESRHE